MEVANKELDDLIIVRSDGSPTYNLCVVVDDLDMKITHVIRGDYHIINTFRQINIFNALEESIPIYGHVPMIMGEDGKRISKRHGAVDINEFKEFGYLPESIINNLILLGWSPKNHKNEIIEINEIINKFKINKLSKSSSIFDYKKLTESDWTQAGDKGLSTSKKNEWKTYRQKLRDITDGLDEDDLVLNDGKTKDKEHGLLMPTWPTPPA